jgi:hypothetical protein
VVMAVELIIYCDESDDKGEFYSTFYGGALLYAKDRKLIEETLKGSKGGRFAQTELKWTKIKPQNEDLYIRFVESLFKLIAAGKLKLRIMFTQNINQTRGLVEYSVDDEYFILYYHFVKLAFGLRYCNPERKVPVNVTLYLDDVPDTEENSTIFETILVHSVLFRFFTPIE